MEQCSAEPGCLSIDYVARAGGDHTVNDCVLFRSGGGDTPTSSCAKKTNDMAYVIDPPEEDAPDTAAVACSTECPYANGQTVGSQSYYRINMLMMPVRQLIRRALPHRLRSPTRHQSPR